MHADPTTARLVASHRRFLAFVQSRVRDPVIAEEIVQSAFVRAAEKGDQLRDDEKATAWFYRLLRNAIVDHVRRADARDRNHDRFAEEAPSASPAPDEALHAVVCACLDDLVPTLEPSYAEVLRLAELDDLPVKEVAGRLGITPNLASVRLHRARHALRRALERACGTCTEHGCLDCTCQRPA